MGKGSIILEFLLMLPVLLLLFGMTMLFYDDFHGQLHLQESNRILAWSVGDRYDANQEFDEKAVSAAKAQYERRNAWEKALDSSGDDFWTFGDKPDSWAVNIEERKTPAGTNAVYFGKTDWAMLTAGNMELRMTKVAPSYIGILAVSSAVQGMGEKVEDSIVAHANAFTHTKNALDAGGDDDFAPEAVVVRRMSNVHEDRYDSFTRKFVEIAVDDWPGFAERKTETEAIKLPEKQYKERVLGFYTQ